jgi:protoheme IX farnesyltransferase
MRTVKKSRFFSMNALFKSAAKGCALIKKKHLNIDNISNFLLGTEGNIVVKEETYSRFSGFIRLTKFRLGALVVFSALITYFTVADHVEWQKALALGIGGFLVTGAANGFNQIIEKDLDSLMERTKQRPLPLQVLGSREALVFCGLAGVAGTLILWMYINPLAGILGFISIVLYALLYTPLKQRTPFAVFVGAFPGALPTLIGGVAATGGFGQVTFFALLLFLIQFVWQFPHFWALAWFNDEDYARANFYLLPSQGGKDHFSRFQILVYSMFLLVASIFPFIFRFVGILSTAACILCGLALLLQAYNFYRLPTDKNAKRLFFVTLVYLPVVQLALMTRA